MFSTTDAPFTNVVERRPDDERTTPPAQGALGAVRCPWTSFVWLCSANSMASNVAARALKLRSGANGTPFASVVDVTGRFTAFLITVRDAMAVSGRDWKNEAENKLGFEPIHNIHALAAHNDEQALAFPLRQKRWSPWLARRRQETRL